MPDNKFIHLLIPLVRSLFLFESPTDKLLSGFFRENKKLDSDMRKLSADTIYTILRNYYKLTAILDNHIPNIIGLTWLKLLNIDIGILSKINLLDTNFLNNLQFKNDNQSQLELPEWIIEELSRTLPENEIVQLAKSMQQPASLDLRVNLIKSDINKAFTELSKYNAQKMEYSPFGLRLEDHTFLAKHPLFLNGSIEVQDQSSQLAGLLLNPKRGEMVVDFCAGAGGKTLLFGMLMRNSGRIYAFDINEKRLNNLGPRMARSGLSNIYPQLIAHENDAKIKRLYNKIDKVFVDAPCSGLGTLRRNPELKFRQTPQSIQELNLKQESILEQASKLVKIGGYLVYATCSILFSENQKIVMDFLHNHKEFKLIPAYTILSHEHLKRDDGFLALLPHIHHSDGFFAALLQRQD